MNDIASQQDILKADPFGTISKGAGSPDICRDTDPARWWARGIARRLAAREARALIVLDDLAGIPKLLSWNGRQLRREWLNGAPMQESRPAERRYFRDALRLLRRMHGHNIAHNDLAKEANCLVLASGASGFIDFQLSIHAPRRGLLFASSRQLASTTGRGSPGRRHRTVENRRREGEETDGDPEVEILAVPHLY